MRRLTQVSRLSFLNGKVAPLAAKKHYSIDMNRRIDEKTAERINLALLTRAAFDPYTALTYARLSGLSLNLVDAVFERAPSRVRQQRSFFLPATDRRVASR